MPSCRVRFHVALASAICLSLAGCASESDVNQFDVSPFSTAGSKEPFSSTVYPEPTILSQNSISNYTSASYAGLTQRSMFDSRTGEFADTDAHLYTLTYADGDVMDALVNAEFTNEANAALEAQRFGARIGQLPAALRTGVDELWIHKGDELWGSAGNALYVHTGLTEQYQNAGILEETLLHEAVHVALDEDHEKTEQWKAAQISDDNYISTYAKDNAATEDFSESFLMWMAARYRTDALSPDNLQRIEQAIPARLSYLDQQGFDMRPIGP